MEEICTPPKIDKGTKRVIICEGEHDKHFLDALIKRRSLPDFQILDAYKCCRKGGKDGLAPALNGLSVLTGFDGLRGVAIITDNDDEKALETIETKLRVLDKYVSTEPRMGRMAGIPVVTILIPDYHNQGNLEDLCLPALYEKWPKAKECVRAYLDCTGAIAWEKQKELCKAVVRSIISGFYENDPYKGLGYLFRDNKELADHSCFNGLANILTHFDEIIEGGSF